MWGRPFGLPGLRDGGSGCCPAGFGGICPAQCRSKIEDPYRLRLTRWFLVVHSGYWEADMPAFRLAISCLLMAIMAHGLAPAAQQPAASDADTMLRQAHEEIRNFDKAGGKKDDPSHPVEKWVQALWAFREKSPRNPE